MPARGPDAFFLKIIFEFFFVVGNMFFLTNLTDFQILRVDFTRFEAREFFFEFVPLDLGVICFLII